MAIGIATTTAIVALFVELLPAFVALRKQRPVLLLGAKAVASIAACANCLVKVVALVFAVRWQNISRTTALACAAFALKLIPKRSGFECFFWVAPWYCDGDVHVVLDSQF